MSLPFSDLHLLCLLKHLSNTLAFAVPVVPSPLSSCEVQIPQMEGPGLQFSERFLLSSCSLSCLIFLSIWPFLVASIGRKRNPHPKTCLSPACIVPTWLPVMCLQSWLLEPYYLVSIDPFYCSEFWSFPQILKSQGHRFINWLNWKNPEKPNKQGVVRHKSARILDSSASWTIAASVHCNGLLFSYWINTGLASDHCRPSRVALTNAFASGGVNPALVWI